MGKKTNIEQSVIAETPEQIRAIGLTFYRSSKLLGIFSGEFYDFDVSNIDLFNKMIDENFVLPKIVLQALSAEIALKSFSFKNGKTYKGHSLYDLYLKLNDDIQKKIKFKTKENINLLYPNRNYVDKEFEIDLSENSKIFYEWRYLYEKEEYSLDYEFFDAFVKSLYEI